MLFVIISTKGLLFLFNFLVYLCTLDLGFKRFLSGRLNVQDLKFYYNEKIFVIKRLVLVVFIRLGVAFFTYFERKILGYGHVRLGPNKVFLLGSNNS